MDTAPTQTAAAAPPPAPGRSSGWTTALVTPLWLLPVWAALTALFPPTPFTTLSGLLTLLLLAVCSYTDVRWGRIRNVVTYPTVLGAFALNAVVSLIGRRDPDDGTASAANRWVGALGGVGIGESFAGAVLVFLLMLVVYRIAGGGAGDVKLGAAVGALLGPAAGVNAVLWTYVAAGVGILVWLIVTVGPVKLLGGLARRVGSFLLPVLVSPPTEEDARMLQGKIILGPFFALGTLAVLTRTDVLLTDYLLGRY